MTSYLITGSSRGIGLALVHLLASKPSSEALHIFATARKTSDALSKIIARHPSKLHFVEMEVTSALAVQKAIKEVGRILEANNATLDVLVNNAGIGNMSPDGKFGAVTNLEETLNTNVLGPHLVTAACLPLLRKSKVKKIINLTSEVASISQARLYRGIPAHGYKVSKAALNMLTLQYALDLASEDFCVIALAPGSTQTDMGGRNALLTVEQSVKGIYGIITRVGKNDSGKYINNSVEEVRSMYSGQELPW
ncbi:short-chain dehydrogenase/reductase SDR [Flagelloscypha sp. PMI_526]|nr:short-chain dehydrogenase/reductase SDR [Flagelloscypha sp. PMI_526]